MKNLLKYFGMIALTAIIGFSFVACENPSGGGGGGGGGPTLTITGLDDYNDKYIIVMGSVGMTALGAANKIPSLTDYAYGNLTGGKISGGKVSLKTFEVGMSGVKAYAGSDQDVNLVVRIYNAAEIDMMSDTPVTTGSTTVDFTNGSGTGSGVFVE